MGNFIYSHTHRLTVEEFADILHRSTLAERRPVEDPAALEAMLAHANLLCTAWDRNVLVGVARSFTDFAYCCYLSDLAVDTAYQKQGIGRGLIQCTQAQLAPKARIVLLAAPKAQAYYPKLGFERHPSAWTLP